MNLKKDEIEKMQKLIGKYKQIVCYVDGSSLNNPGSSGAGVVFSGTNKDDNDDMLDFHNSSSQDELDAILIEDDKIEKFRAHNLM